MKKLSFIILVALLSTVAYSQSDEKQQQIISDSKEAKQTLIKADGSMNKLFSSSHGYVIFPNVGKGGLGVGGASGKGAVYEKGKLIGMAKLTQVTIGLQAGGQSFIEVIFFEDKKHLDRFKENKVEFSAQMSAVAAAEGASKDAKYVEGVMIFTKAKKGLMAEVSAGGQKFKFTPL